MDDAWIEAAIERYQRAEHLLADFDKAIAKVEVTVRSPDGLVEVVVAADGAVRDVVISDSAQGRPVRELSQAVQAAVAAAADAAAWARNKLHKEMFGGERYADLRERPAAAGRPGNAQPSRAGIDHRRQG